MLNGLLLFQASKLRAARARGLNVGPLGFGNGPIVNGAIIRGY